MMFKNKSAAPEGDRADNRKAPVETAFWGWRMVVAGVVTSIVTSGIGFYGHSVILDPLRNAFQWSKGDISLALTLYFLTAGPGQMLIGKQIDRHGPQVIMTIGAVTFGTGFILLGHISHLWQLYLIYPIMSIGWCCTGVVPINTLITNWFIRRRGLAMSLAMTGLSLGGVIIVPLAAWIIIGWGLEIALVVLGLLYILGVVPISLRVIKASPADVGQVPDGRPILPQGARSPAPSPEPIDPPRKWTRMEAARTTAFWAIAIGFLFALCGQMAFLIHQISFLSKYLGVKEASWIVSITALASVIGRLALGSFVDRLNKRLVAIGCFLLQALMLVLMAYNHHVVTLYAGTFVFGLTMGNILMMQSLLIGDCFGMISFGTIFGAATLFSMAGSALGPWLAGFLFDLTGSYSRVFIIFSIFSLLASVIILFACPPMPVSKTRT